MSAKLALRGCDREAVNVFQIDGDDVWLLAFSLQFSDDCKSGVAPQSGRRAAWDLCCVSRLWQGTGLRLAANARHECAATRNIPLIGNQGSRLKRSDSLLEQPRNLRGFFFAEAVPKARALAV